jgi:hypothetical protein
LTEVPDERVREDPETLENHCGGNYPSDNNDPDCAKVFTYRGPDGNTYSHGPCSAWPAMYKGRWSYSHTGSADARTRDWHDALSRAIGAWNNEPYRNPLFEEGASCNLCITEAVLPDAPNTTNPGGCGITQYVTVQNDSGRLAQANVILNLDSRIVWYDNSSTFDSQVPAGTHYACDLASVTLHEIGHAQALGHSMYSGDIMFYGGTPSCSDGVCIWVETVDPDAKQALHIVYGDLQQTSSGSSGGGGWSCDTGGLAAGAVPGCHNSIAGEIPANLGNPLETGWIFPALDWAQCKAQNYPNQFTPLQPAPSPGSIPRLPDPIPTCRPECPPGPGADLAPIPLPLPSPSALPQ